jgi:predicted transcriptional regulator
MQVAPRARRDGLIAQPLDNDLVVYEAESGTAHRLDTLATTVWRLADGTLSVADIARRAGVNERAVTGALLKLQSVGLLATTAQATRRWALRRGAIAA